jgi:hypothetical protein
MTPLYLVNGLGWGSGQPVWFLVMVDRINKKEIISFTRETKHQKPRTIPAAKTLNHDLIGNYPHHYGTVFYQCI